MAVKALTHLLVFCLIGTTLLLSGCDTALVNTPPEASFAVSADSELRVGEEILFLNQSAHADAYLWDFGDGTTSTEARGAHVFTAPGAYTVTLEAQADGLTDEATLELEILEAVDNRRLLFIDNTEGLMKSYSLAEDTLVALFQLPGDCIGLVYDQTNNYLYYTDNEHGTLVRSRLSGNNQSIMVDNLNNPQGLALDQQKNTLFLAERSLGQVLGLNVGDIELNVLFDTADSALFHQPVAIDFLSGTLYMTLVAEGSEAVWIGKADGTGLQQILSFEEAGYGFGITVDGSRQQLYLDNDWGDEILSAAIDGTGVQSLATSTARSYGMDIDEQHQLLYYTEQSGSVYELDLATGEQRLLYQTDHELMGLIVVEWPN
ncbi:MAG TPA: hypothetical protein DCE41_24925 [Cytophagales bacterium]|nr:hypothetical protein [Cytophagales bacterium]HAA23221.1 hypothetical protein [Cytophagales bacterium]HAP58491.1 hypothetical protein [Cytophagales bacterium]